MEIFLWMAGSLLVIGSFLGIWSYLSDPEQFIEALGARISLFFINFTVIAKSIATSFLSTLYVIFDPFPIIIDDVAVIAITVYVVKKTLKKMVKASFPFPTPWSRH
ncbi:MAG: hypothetical protein AAF824_06870 [Bacteroidota bacterium]